MYIQQRDNRWCIADLVSKHGRVRTIPVPRRTIAGSLSWVLAQPQFWNTKDPADYSDDEKHGMIANSPRAK
jgi:hypothetical protein